MIGIVFGCYAPMHQGHLDVLFKAKKECDRVVVFVCGSDSDRGSEYNMPLIKRYMWIKEYFENDELVDVYMIDETLLDIPEYPNGWSKWLGFVDDIFYSNYSDDRVWYVGELDYVKHLNNIGENVIYLDRKKHGISATLIRANPYKYFDKIVPTFRHVFNHKILITGTASEGKSTLVSDLAKYFYTDCSVEFGKEDMVFNAKLETKLDVNDYLSFLKNQYELTLNKINSSRCVFFGDTDNLVTLMYAKYYAGDNDFDLSYDDYFVIEEASKKYNFLYKWDKIFLLKPHNKFVDDGIRYMKHSDMKIRMEMFNILCNFLKEFGLWDRVTILDGNYYDNFCEVVNYTRGVINEEVFK